MNFKEIALGMLEIIGLTLFAVTLTILLAKYGLWLIKILNIL